ncbi:FAD NADPH DEHYDROGENASE/OXIDOREDUCTASE [Salix koriyanagi]|uniref:FAD NADPH DEHYDROGENASE/OXIDOREDUCTASE n=1 Tax=Salix koriyanagi TaxID=2511006 RepID=A0A9Q0ZUP0_9ROSI|nr:FAD NADPH DEHYDROGENASE/OXIDOREDUCTASE [Salix koriyanagi]
MLSYYEGMAGGELVVTPVENTGFVPEEATIVGNTCLYGATGGQVFVRGKAGERFAVRNSLAEAVVEGTGDHCCEYMTGGCVVVLGKVGRNVAAGMTGGLAYILDEDDSLMPKVNKEIVKVQRVTAPVGQMQLKSLVEAHVEKTGSGKGAAILKEWDAYLPLFWQLVPPSEEDTPEACATYEATSAGQVTSFQSA